MSQLTHINAAGEAHMVDVSAKAETVREARAEAFVTMRSETLAMIIDGRHHKGDVFATARIAGIQAAKRTWDLIPLCHPLMLSKVEVNLQAEPEHNRVRIETLCRLTGKTGVEMEALTAASVAALTIYDMCKAVQKDMVIGPVRLLAKSNPSFSTKALSPDIRFQAGLVIFKRRIQHSQESAHHQIINPAFINGHMVHLYKLFRRYDGMMV